MKKFTVMFGLLLSLAACSEDLPPPMPAAKNLPPKIMLDVQQINLADRTDPQASSPYNSNHFTPTINAAIHQWATDRLQAAGQSGQAIVLIKEASLTAQVLPTKSGIDSWFTRQQSVKYTGRAEVSIEANGRPGFASANANATRSITLPENPSEMEKQDAYYHLLTGLMKDLNNNLESSINTHMANFMTTAPSAMQEMPMDNAPMPMNNVSVPAPMVVDSPASPTAAALLPPAPPTPAAVAPAVIPLSGRKK